MVEATQSYKVTNGQKKVHTVIHNMSMLLVNYF